MQSIAYDDYKVVKCYIGNKAFARMRKNATEEKARRTTAAENEQNSFQTNLSDFSFICPDWNFEVHIKKTKQTKE